MNNGIDPQAVELATNLVKLTKEFVSTDPGQSAHIKRAFKTKSKNDTVRTVAYLLEVVGSKDFECKQLQQEIADLKELLTANGISLEGPTDEEVKQGVAEAASEGTGTPSSVGSTENIASPSPQTAGLEGVPSQA